MSSVPQSILCRKLWAALRPLLDCIGGVGLGVGKAGTCVGGVGGPWFFCAAVSVLYGEVGGVLRWSIVETMGTGIQTSL